MVLRASGILPISGPPLRDAAIQISANRITGITLWRDLPVSRRRAAIELGDVLLLPGLVNTHCHLDYTHMAGQLPPPNSFTDWLRLIVSIKAGWTLEDYASSWNTGAAMLLRSGTTTVADIEAVPQLLPRMWASTPLRVISFLEMIGISNRRPANEVLREALNRYEALLPTAFPPGLSPHSPYSTSAELLRLSSRAARQRRLLLSTHVAESLAESHMFCDARGEMFDWLKRSGRDMSDCGNSSPVSQNHRCGMLGPNLLAAHVNYLSRGDARLLGARRVNVVHCPRSHFYFNHRPFPLRPLGRAGVNICLGTDSLASVYKRRNETVNLDMFAEMRALAEAQPSLSPRAILRMATVNGAHALGLSGRLGVLAKGALADVIALPLPQACSNLYRAAMCHEGPVLASMIAGRWAIAPGGE